MAQHSDPFVYRPLRRSDLESFTTVVLQSMGDLERSTGLDRSSEALIRSFSRWGIWGLFRFSQLIGRPFIDVFVALRGHRVVGTGSLMMFPQAGYIAAMATEPEFRGRGIASRILTLGQSAAGRRGRRWLALDVERENLTAIRVYQRAGFREIAQCTWYARTGLPPTSATAARDVRAAKKSELKKISPLLDANRVADYGTALPAFPRMLSHLEFLVQGMRTPQQTWLLESANGSVRALRTFYVAVGQLGVYFPLVGAPDPTSEELLPLFDQGSAWLTEKRAQGSLVVVPNPAGIVGSVVERLGFAPVAHSMTMVRPNVTGTA